MNKWRTKCVDCLDDVWRWVVGRANENQNIEKEGDFDEGPIFMICPKYDGDYGEKQAQELVNILNKLDEELKIERGWTAKYREEYCRRADLSRQEEDRDLKKVTKDLLNILGDCEVDHHDQNGSQVEAGDWGKCATAIRGGK